MKKPSIQKPLNIIVAVDESAGFGKGGKIPWHYSEDMKNFRKVTNGSACIMGRKTYFDMFDMVVEKKSKGKKKDKPVVIPAILPGRDSYVVSKTLTRVEGATVAPSLGAAVSKTKKKTIFVLGGERLFVEALSWVNRIYMTIVPGYHDCDRFFPVQYLTKHFKIVEGRQSGELKFVTYQRIKQ